jgi:hypothetical protein
MILNRPEMELYLQTKESFCSVSAANWDGKWKAKARASQARKTREKLARKREASPVPVEHSQTQADEIWF